jgi:hypothetical protein
MTSASTATSQPMTRMNTNEMLIKPLEQMCRVSSHIPEAGFSEAQTMTNDFHNFDVDTVFPDSFDSAVCNDLSDVSFPSFPQTNSVPQSFISGGVDMLPSPSQESNVSNSSSDSSQPRHMRRVQKQNLQSKRPLAPKTQSNKQVPTTPPTTFVEIMAEDGTSQKKAQIPRASKAQKETIKVFCHFCNDHKDGFKGDHELRRHINRLHKNVREVFICKDISPDGTFLSNCKHCRNMKTYGASYNAAAHLRRVHFNPATTPKGGRGKVSQGRGGSGGGDQPPMNVLKDWMFSTWEANVNGLVVEEDPVSDNSYHRSSQSSSSDAGIQPDDKVQITDVDLEFVQQITHLDMSFHRYTNPDATDIPLQSPTFDLDVFLDSQQDQLQQDLLFFNNEFTG